jgi:hypothetical protein
MHLFVIECITLCFDGYDRHNYDKDRTSLVRDVTYQFAW